MGTTRTRQPGAVAVRAAVAIGDDLGRRLLFVALAERAEAARLRAGTPSLNVVRPLGPVLGDDHPAADDRIFTQFGHGELLQGGAVLRLAT